MRTKLLLTLLLVASALFAAPVKKIYPVKYDSGESAIRLIHKNRVTDSVEYHENDNYDTYWRQGNVVFHLETQVGDWSQMTTLTYSSVSKLEEDWNKWKKLELQSLRNTVKDLSERLTEEQKDEPLPPIIKEKVEFTVPIVPDEPKGQRFITLEKGDEMPRYRGGDMELLKFLQENVKYPEDAKSDGIQGRVVIKFLINKFGDVERPEIVKSLYPSCDKEAIRVIKSMPKWIPGQKKGFPIDVFMELPVIFRLQM